MEDFSNEKSKDIDWYDTWRDYYTIARMRKYESSTIAPQSEIVIALVLNDEPGSYTDSEIFSCNMRYYKKHKFMTIKGIDINENIDFIMGYINRSILEYKLFIEKHPDCYSVCVYDEKNEKYLYLFLRDNELERIDSECGEKVVKYRKFSSSTNRQRAIGYLLYELRELHGEEYDSDLKAIRTVRKYTICGENLLENLVYRTVTTLFLGGIYVSQENVLKNVKYSL